MRKNLGARPVLYPQNAFIIGTYDEKGTPDAMIAAWGGVADKDKIFIALANSHKTTENIQKRKAFTVSMATVEQYARCDYVGLVSANKEKDKFEKSGFHAVGSENVDAPLIEELPLALECKLISYDPVTDYLFGEIVNVCADESILDADGNIDPKKLNPVIFDGANRAYYSLGERIGTAFKDGAKLKRRETGDFRTLISAESSS